jgi:hypothetical protein
MHGWTIAAAAVSSLLIETSGKIAFAFEQRNAGQIPGPMRVGRDRTRMLRTRRFCLQNHNLRGLASGSAPARDTGTSTNRTATRTAFRREQ